MMTGRGAPGAETSELAGDASGSVTTDHLVAATGVSRETLYGWVSRRLLPLPQVSSTTATWPPGTLERVHIRRREAGDSLAR
jgi:hypothetical protein